MIPSPPQRVRPVRRCGALRMAFVRQAVQDGHDRLAALVLFMATSGARVTEAINLRWCEVDLRQRSAMLAPDVGLIVAAALFDDHVPPLTLELNVVEPPIQMACVPLKVPALGGAFMRLMLAVANPRTDDKLVESADIEIRHRVNRVHDDRMSGRRDVLLQALTNTQRLPIRR